MLRTTTTTNYLLGVMRATIFFLWAGTAFAAGASLVEHPDHYVIDTTVAALAAVISTLSGITALAWRVNKVLMETPDKPIVKPWLFACAHVGGSWMAGIAMWLGARINGWGPDTALLLVLVGSFGGAKLLEVWADKYLPIQRILPDVGKPDKEE